MLFFKSKKKDDQKEPLKAPAPEKKDVQETGEESFEKNEIDYDNPSLVDIAMIISRNGFKVYSHDQGRKELEKRLKANIK